MKTCKFCYRPITEEVIAEKRRRKVENAKASARKTKLNGNKSGPKSKIDWIAAWRMREKYFSKTRIAKELGISRSWVSREFSKRGWK